MERGVVGNSALGNFLIYNFVKIKFSENRLLGIFLPKFLKNYQKYHENSPLPKQNFYMPYLE